MTTDTVLAERLLIHADFVRRLARSLVSSDADADDVAQETWLATLRDGESLRAIERPRAWFTTLARNLASNARRGANRRAQRERAADSVRAASSPAEIVEREALRRRVIEAVLALDEPYRHTMIARYLDEVDTATIAARDGVPVETVRTRLKRANAVMRSRLEDEDPQVRTRLAVLAGVSERAASAMSLQTLFAGAAFVVICGVAALLGSQSLSTATEVAQQLKAALAAPPVGVPDFTVDAQTAEPLHSVHRSEVAPAPPPIAQPVDPWDLTLRVRCVDTVQRPIAVATVDIVEHQRDANGDPALKVHAASTTDDAGMAELSRPQLGDLPLDRRLNMFLRFRAPGFATRWQFLPSGVGAASDWGDVALDPGGRLEGAVLDSGGRPLAGVPVVVADARSLEIESSARWQFGVLASKVLRVEKGTYGLGRTDSAGRFSFEGIPIGAVRIYGRADGNPWFRSNEVEIERIVTAQVTLNAPANDELREFVVTVRDRNGVEVPNARVRHACIGKAFDPVFGEVRNQYAICARNTDLRGELVVKSRRGDMHMFEVSDGRAVLTRTELVDTTNGSVTLRVDETRSMSVRVTARDGSKLPPIRAATIDMDPMWAFAGSQSVEASGSDVADVDVEVPAIDFKLTISADGFRDVELGPYSSANAPERIEVTLDPVELDPGAAAEQADIRSRGMITGRVALDPGSDLKAFVASVDRRTRAVRTAPADRFGRYWFPFLSPGEYLVRVFRDEESLARARTELAATPNLEELTGWSRALVAAGKHTRVDLELGER